LTNTDLISAEVPALSAEVRRPAILISLVMLALVLRIYAISLYPLAGDEYGSLAEAKSVGVNWNSIIYSGLMHFWIRLGTSELWLRLPSAIFGMATVVILFKIGEKLGGWRTGVIAALLAATSPFNIYHSQEVRFYSLFIFASAAFMLATINYVDSRKGVRDRMAVLAIGAVLVLSHVFGILAIYAQAAASFLAGDSRWSRRTRMMVMLGVPIVVFGLPLIPPVRQKLWEIAPLFYTRWTTAVAPSFTPISSITLAKVAFTGYIFVFGYHVYPLWYAIVVPGACISALLTVKGAIELWKTSAWRFLLPTYLIALFGIYLVLDSVSGRLASGVAPRHVAFVWPAFLLLTAIGLTSFKKPVLIVLVAAALTVNAASIWSGWQKDWTYGAAVDYRGAAEQTTRWIGKDTALIHDGRSQDAVKFYFPKSIPLIDSWAYVRNPDLTQQILNQRLIFVTDDWEPGRRREFDQLMGRLNETYSIVDGHVDYPLFEYSLERKSSSALYELRGESNQVLQPISFYGLEFQDLRLPISVKVSDVPLLVIGAYGLPDFEARRELLLPLSAPVQAKRVVFLSDIVGAGTQQTDQMIAEILVENKGGKTLTLPIRLGKETTSWDKQCAPAVPCQTIFHWHKRIAVVGQNRYEGALRDFSAGLHGVVLDLPEQQEVVRLTIRYAANSGSLYVWGVALPSN